MDEEIRHATGAILELFGRHAVHEPDIYLREEIDRVVAEVGALGSSEREELEDKIAKLENDYEDAKEAREDAEKERDEAEGELENVKDRLEEVETKRGEADKLRREAVNELAAVKRELIKVRTERDQAVAEHDQALAERDQALAERDQALASAAPISEADVAALRAAVEREHQAAQTERATAETMAAVEDLRRELDELRGDYEAAVATGNHQQAELKKLRAALAERPADHADTSELQARVTELEQALAERKAMHLDAERACAEQVEIVKRVAEELAETRALAEQHATDARSIAAERDKAARAMHKAAEITAQQAQRIEHLKYDLRECQTARDAAKASRLAAEEALERALSAGNRVELVDPNGLNELRTEVGRLEYELARAVGERDHYKSEFGAASPVIERLDTEIASLQTDLNTANEQARIAHLDTVKAQEQAGRLREQLEAAQALLRKASHVKREGGVVVPKADPAGDLFRALRP